VLVENSSPILKPLNFKEMGLRKIFGSRRESWRRLEKIEMELQKFYSSPNVIMITT
jgi:hypothetical protein